MTFSTVSWLNPVATYYALGLFLLAAAIGVGFWKSKSPEKKRYLRLFVTGQVLVVLLYGQLASIWFPVKYGGDNAHMPFAVAGYVATLVLTATAIGLNVALIAIITSWIRRGREDAVAVVTQ